MLLCTDSLLHPVSELGQTPPLPLNRLLFQLVVRSKRLKEFDPECARELLQLRVLSLSHNRFDSLNGFENFVNLTEVRLCVRAYSTCAYSFLDVFSREHAVRVMHETEM